MSFIDKITGRAKRTAGEATDNAHLRQQGRKEEEKGEAKERQAEAEEKAQAERERAERLDDAT